MRWTKTFRATIRRWGTQGRAVSPGLERPGCCANDSSMHLANQRLVANEILLIVRVYLLSLPSLLFLRRRNFVRFVEIL